jgi:hypothetical protein
MSAAAYNCCHVACDQVIAAAELESEHLLAGGYGITDSAVHSETAAATDVQAG